MTAPRNRDHETSDSGLRPARVAMIGAGQLARMTHQAAIDYGINLHVLATDPTDPAVTAGAAHSFGDPDNRADLAAAAAHGDVVTFDHELVGRHHLRALAYTGVIIRPNPDSLAFACDKLYLRQSLGRLGPLRVPAPAYAAVTDLDDVIAFADAHAWPVVLKRRSGGYDGRGVRIASDPLAAAEILASTDAHGWMVEEYLDIDAEFAILAARNPSGHIAVYPPIATTQTDGICRELTMPADLPADLVDTAVRYSTSILAGIDATGTCAVEYFYTTDGRLLLNELALRPHNSGHATIEACVTSQFHQHLRAILDWPLGSTDLVSPAATVNLIAGSDTGDLSARLPAALGIPDTHIHLYQKAARPGRKIGHVTALGATTGDALASARTAAHILIEG